MSLSEREILFEYEGWEISGIPGCEDWFDEVYHKCAWKHNWLLKKKGMGIETMEHGTYCWSCGEEIPEAIMGVWKLKNFDLLQTKAQNEAEWKNLKYSGSFYLHPINTKPGGITVLKP